MIVLSVLATIYLFFGVLIARKEYGLPWWKLPIVVVVGPAFFLIRLPKAIREMF